MVGLADENGREYECIYGTYSKEDGFRFNNSVIPIVNDEGWRGMVNILFHEDLWRLAEKEIPKEMTISDIEKELGYRIRIVDPTRKNEEYRELSPEEKERIDTELEFLKRLFGIDIDPEEYY